MMVGRHRAVLVTGQPSCGKTTLVRQLFERAQSRGGDALNITGFVTDEALTKGHRTGFDVVTVPTGNRGVLARHGLKSKHKTGAYGVDVASFEALALPELQVTGGDKPQVVIIDEIGRMEMHSTAFGPAVKKLLEAPNVYLIGSVAAPRYGHVVPLAEEIKVRDDVTVIHMKKSTRDEAKAEAERAVDRLLDEMLPSESTSSKNKRKREP